MTIKKNNIKVLISIQLLAITEPIGQLHPAGSRRGLEPVTVWFPFRRASQEPEKLSHEQILGGSLPNCTVLFRVELIYIYKIAVR